MLPLNCVTSKIINNPNTTLVMISIIAGLLTVIFTYLFAITRFNQSDAFFAALLMLTNPLLWFYDELALNYSLEAFFSIAIGYSFFLAMKGSKSWAILGILLLGIGGGFRQTVLFIFLPLAIFTFLHHTWKLRIFAGVLLTLICLSWAIPLVSSVGGLSAYLTASKLLSNVLEPPSVRMLIHAFFYSGHISFIFFLLTLIGLIRLPAGFFFTWEKTFLSLWILPNLLVISLFHIGQSGYVLFFQPVLMIYTPFLIRTGLPQLEMLLFKNKTATNQNYHAKTKLLLGTIIFINIISFFSGGYYAISNHDHLWKKMIGALQKYPPSETLVLTGFEPMIGFRVVSFYLPEYHVYGFSTNELKEPFPIYRSEFAISKWVFHSYNHDDDYELGIKNNDINVTLEIPPNTKGLIVTDPALWNRLMINQDSELIPMDGELINDKFMYLALPRNSSKLVVSLGNLIVQP